MTPVPPDRPDKNFMKDILVHIGHPAHVHLFRHPVEAWRNQGRKVRLALRDKDLTLDLARHYGLNGRVLSTAGTGLAGGMLEMLEQDLGLAREVIGRRSLLVGTSIAIAHIGWLLRMPSVVLVDDDIDVLGLNARLWFPFCTAIVAPEGVRMGRFRDKALHYPSFQKMFYLHPNRFRPDPGIRGELGLAASERFAVVRLSALQAHHDRSAGGMRDEHIREVLNLAGSLDIRVFISSEKPLTAGLNHLRFPIPPERMHDALAQAEFFLGDSQSMTVEAALLGTPAFRLNTFVGRISVLNELEDRGLAYGFRPGREDQLLAAMKDLLGRPDYRDVFAARREKMLAVKIDPLPWFLRIMDMFANGEPLPEIQRLAAAE